MDSSRANNSLYSGSVRATLPSCSLRVSLDYTFNHLLAIFKISACQGISYFFT